MQNEGFFADELDRFFEGGNQTSAIPPEGFMLPRFSAAASSDLQLDVHLQDNSTMTIHRPRHILLGVVYCLQLPFTTATCFYVIARSNQIQCIGNGGSATQLFASKIYCALWGEDSPQPFSSNQHKLVLFSVASGNRDARS
jgi:hypothetical protein